MTTKRAFWDEMNRHANTDYRCVNGKYIIEYSNGPLTRTNSLDVWRHVRDGEAKEERGERGYGHPWINVASRTGDPDEMDRLYSELTTERAIMELRDSKQNMNHSRP